MRSNALDVLYAIPAARAALSQLAGNWLVAGYAQGGLVAVGVAEAAGELAVPNFLGAISVSGVAAPARIFSRLAQSPLHTPRCYSWLKVSAPSFQNFARKTYSPLAPSRCSSTSARPVTPVPGRRFALTKCCSPAGKIIATSKNFSPETPQVQSPRQLRFWSSAVAPIPTCPRTSPPTPWPNSAAKRIAWSLSVTPESRHRAPSLVTPSANKSVGFAHVWPAAPHLPTALDLWQIEIQRIDIG